MPRYQKCIYDGGDLVQIKNGKYKCSHCDSILTENDLNVYANSAPIQMLSEIDAIRNFRQEGDFYKANSRIRELLNNPNYTSYKANYIPVYWQALLCDYYIVIDITKEQNSLKYSPIFYNFNYTSIYKNPNYKALIKLCKEVNDEKALISYKYSINKINAIRDAFFKVKDQKQKYSIYLTSKHYDSDGAETEEFKISSKLYNKLKSNNKEVFFFEKTLVNVEKESLEPHRYNALLSSSVLVIVCTNPKSIETGVVKSDWSRFLSFSKTAKRRIIIVLPERVQKSTLPKPLLNISEATVARQFVFYKDDEDVISKIENALEQTDSLKEKKYRNLLNNDYKIKEILKREGITNQDLKYFISLIERQTVLLDEYKLKFYETPAGITPKEVLSIYIEEASYKNEKYRAEENIKSERIFDLKNKIKNQSYVINGIIYRDFKSSENYLKLKQKIEDQKELINEFSNLSDVNKKFDNSVIVDIKQLSKVLSDYQNSCKDYFLKKMQEFEKSFFEVVSKEDFNEYIYSKFEKSINRHIDNFEEISKLDLRISSNELKYKSRLEFNNYITEVNSKLRHKKIKDEKDQRIKREQKLQMQKELHQIQLRDAKLVSFVANSKSKSFIAKNLRSLIDIQIMQLNKFKDNWGDYPNPKFVKFNNPTILNQKYSTAVNEYKEEIERINQIEEKKKEQAKIKSIYDKIPLMRQNENKINSILERPRFSDDEFTYLKLKVEKQREMVQDFIKIIQKPLENFKYDTVSKVNKVIRVYENEKRMFLEKAGAIINKDLELFTEVKDYMNNYRNRTSRDGKQLIRKLEKQIEKYKNNFQIVNLISNKLRYKTVKDLGTTIFSLKDILNKEQRRLNSWSY